jgi:DNA-binding GntR family transcriptional regulator
MRRLAIIPLPAVAQAEGANDYREAEAANARFHMAIAAAARNTLAQELIERCLAQVDRFMSLGVQVGPFQEGATAAHLAIVDAIGARDPMAAQARMEEHLDCGSQRMKDMLLRGQLSAVSVG